MASIKKSLRVPKYRQPFVRVQIFICTRHMFWYVCTQEKNIINKYVMPK
jgi:hypothetical protein